MPIQELRINSLSANNAQVFDTELQIIDDRGGIALGSGNLFVPGDGGTAIVSPAGTVTGIAPKLDGIFTDISTGNLLSFGSDATTAFDRSSSSTITHILDLSDSTGAVAGPGRQIVDTNGQPVVFDVGRSDDMVFQGAGRVVLFSEQAGRLYDINIDTGVAVDLGAFTRPNAEFAETWASFGVAEFFNGQISLAYRDGNSSTIVRQPVAGGAIETIATFSDLGDLASFTVSPEDGRWYFRYELESEFGEVNEAAGYADASVQLNAVVTPTPVPDRPVFFVGAEGDDVINGNSRPNTIEGRAGNDTINGGADGDQISGGDGNDVINGNTGEDTINGNVGDDFIQGGDGRDQIQGGQGNDTINGDFANDIVFGDLGDDVINGNSGNDTVNGGIGNDTLQGGQGDDLVQGGQGNDILFGDLGNDRLSGDFGNDTISGGAGSDLFEFRANQGNDVITDFDAAAGDRLSLFGQTYTATDDGSSTTLFLSGGGTIVLTGVTGDEFGSQFVV